MKNKIVRYKTNKILLFILIITLIFFVVGLLFPAFLSKDSKNLISNSLNNFFIGIKNNKLNYQEAFFSAFFINTLSILLIWILGISIIGFIFVIIILSIKSFILGFSFSSILTIYGFRGIILGVVYTIPILINLIVIVFLSYYSFNFSIMLYFYLFKKHEYNRRLIVKKYIKVLILSLIIIILSSIIEIFLVPYFLRILI